MNLVVRSLSTFYGLSVLAQDGYSPYCLNDVDCGDYGTCNINQCNCVPPYRSIIGQAPCSINDQNCTTNTDCNYQTGTRGGSCSASTGGTCNGDSNCSCNCFANWLDGSSQCNIDIT